MTEATVIGAKRIPFYRRRWFIILCLLTISPIAWLPLFTGKIYRKASGEGNWVPVKGSSRVIYILLSFWLTAYLFFHYMPVPTSNSPSQTTDSTTPSTSTTSNADSSDADLDNSALRVEMHEAEGVGTSITITSASDSSIAINRVVVNNREATPGCDFSQQMNAQNKAQRAQAGGVAAVLSGDFPAGKVLKTGDQVVLFISADCGALVKAEVYTNQGKGSYTFGQE